MRSILYVQNLRCGGCAATIIQALSSIAGVTNAEVIPEEDKVSFFTKSDSTRLVAILAIKRLGYPAIEDSNSMNDRARSIISCVKGKLQ